MGDKKVLLVEDDPDLMTMMEKKLTLEGIGVMKAETGQQALDVLKSDNKPDLVLLDILLPDIDGLTILNEIASNQDTSYIPVIILSNLDEPGSFEQAAAVGKYEYLVKTKTDLNEVVAKIKRRLGMK